MTMEIERFAVSLSKKFAMSLSEDNAKETNILSALGHTKVQIHYFSGVSSWTL